MGCNTVKSRFPHESKPVMTVSVAIHFPPNRLRNILTLHNLNVIVNQRVFIAFSNVEHLHNVNYTICVCHFMYRFVVFTFIWSCLYVWNCESFRQRWACDVNMILFRVATSKKKLKSSLVKYEAICKALKKRQRGSVLDHQ